MNVPLFKTPTGEEEADAVREVLLSGWVTLGPKTAQFEEEYAAFIGTKHAIGLNSGTAALHLALAIYDFPKDSEVLLSTINFIAAPHSVRYIGLIPVFVDVEEDTLCMDIADLERKITPKTKAIIATHLGGTACDMDAVMALAKKHDLIVVEDVANAVGGAYKGKMLGSIGHLGAHSFEGKKNMTTGDGGAITLNDDAQAELLRRLRWVGINKDTWKRFSEKEGTYSWYYEVADLGYKYNMNDIMAAIGLVQLRKLPGIIETKEAMIAKYNEKLADLPWLTRPGTQEGEQAAHWLYIVKVEKRDEFMQYLQDNEVGSGVHFMPMHLHPLYAQDPKTPVADNVWQHIVSLPLFATMTPDEHDYVIETIRNFPG